MSYDFRESPMLTRAMEQAWGDQVPHELHTPGCLIWVSDNPQDACDCGNLSGPHDTAPGQAGDTQGRVAS